MLLNEATTPPANAAIPITTATIMIPAAAPPELTPFSSGLTSAPVLTEVDKDGPLPPDVVDLEIVVEEVRKAEVLEMVDPVVIGGVGHGVSTGSYWASPFIQVFAGVLR